MLRWRGISYKPKIKFSIIVYFKFHLCVSHRITFGIHHGYGKYLMLHRTVKKNDVNKDKWIGVGGHFEADESPEECLLREVKEETGYTLTSWKYRAIVTFVSGDGVTEYMSLFTADGFTGEQIACDEGELKWVDKKEIDRLNLWEGDKIFFRLLEESEEFFSLKLIYDGNGKLLKAMLNGKPMN